MRRARIATALTVVCTASPALAQSPATPAPAAEPAAQPAAQGRISGTVRAAEGSPVAGATVLAVGTSARAVTSADGRYTLAVPPGTYSVRVTRIGFAPGLVSGVVVPRSGSVTADVQLVAQATALNEVVVVGYGTQRRGDVTGAIASLNTDQIPTLATSSSAGQLLQGRVAGAQVIQNNGAPGGGISIRVRGSNSITANSEPLYVIDGVPAYVGNGGQDPYQNPLASISPSDIESIDVLKDASATAIYGSRGANGVVLITTRQGRRGESRVALESSVGAQEAARRIPMLNGRQFAEMANEARTNISQAAIYTPAEVAALGVGTDWQREIFDRATSQSHTLGFSGGDERTRYFVSGSYFDQGGVIRNTGFQRFTGRVNLDREINRRLQVGTSFTLSNTNATRQPTDNVFNVGSTVMSALWFNPASPVRDSAGAYVQNSPVTFPAQNPVAFVDNLQNDRSVFSVLGNFFGEYRFTDQLRLRSSLGTTSSFDRTRYFAPRTTAIGLNSNGSAEEFSGTTLNLVNENILSYSHRVGEDNLDLTAGFTVQTNRDEGLTGANQQFVTDATGVFDLGAGTQPTTDTEFDKWGLLSYLGRANYTLRDRYVFTVSGRYDGSSRFGANNKWAFFPSGAFAWRAIREPFLRDQRVLSDLKLRVGYGVTGNQEIGLYQSLDRLGTRTYAFGGATVIGYFPSGAAPNPDLRWETTRQVNVGLDLGFANNRVTATLDAYNSRTSDLLLSVTLPATTGYTSQLQNIGSVRNRGVELQLNGALIQRERVTWSSTLSFAANRNKVLDLGVASEIIGPDKGIGGQTGQTTVIIREGEPIGSFLGYRTNGIFQTGETCPLTTRRANLDCVPGEYRYVDANGDGVINLADRGIVGSGQPDFYGGLQNDVTVGPLRLNVFLQGSYGGRVLNAPAINIRNVNILANQTTDALRRWTPTNTATDVPRANAVRPREIYDVHAEDASFLRLQSVTLGYQLPARLVRGTKSARVYVQGDNLQVWTKYKGFDPESNSFGGNAVSRGIDLGSYPRPRSVTAGLNLNF
jgi:TonB-linked SusC/RagA family outer membrane protein